MSSLTGNNSPNFENIVYLYVCDHPQRFESVDADFFTNEYIKALYSLTKGFYYKFQEIPFDIKDPDVTQIREISFANIKNLQIKDDLSEEENVDAFIRNAKNVLDTEYIGLSKEWLIDNVDSWIAWKNFETGVKNSIEYTKTTKITPSNVKSVINKARDMISSRSSINLDDQQAKDFMDPESHIQVPLENLVNSGYPNLNTWLSGDPSGGFEPGTVSLLIGESNIGKSIWLGSLAYNMFIGGKNVLIISLEMSEAKIFKRLGSRAFNIETGNYRDASNDVKFVAEKMKEFRRDRGINPLGELYSQKLINATSLDIETFAKKEAERLGLKWHAIVIDYMTEMENMHGINPENMYIYHKSNASDLYKMAGRNDWAIVSAHQIKGDDYGADDLTLRSLGESKGIIHVVDNIIGIIQTPEMRMEKRYTLKNLKVRDGEYKNWKIPYEIDYNYMTISERDSMNEPEESISIEGSGSSNISKDFKNK